MNSYKPTVSLPQFTAIHTVVSVLLTQDYWLGSAEGPLVQLRMLLHSMLLTQSVRQERKE